MANPTDVLYQLQVKLNSNYMARNIQVNTTEEDIEEEIKEDIGQNSTAGLASTNVRSGDVDVDDAAAADKPYVTHISMDTDEKIDDTRIKIENLLATFEQEMPEEKTAPEEAPVEETPPVEPPPEETPEETPNAMGDEMEGMPPGGDPNVMGGNMGMGGEQEIQSPSEIGRIYELKKIYTRLTTIESYLSDSSDPDLLRIRLLVSKSIELFEILSSNIPSYQPPKAPKERIDEIIIMYYKFLKQIYESVAKHYKEQNAKLKSDGLYKTVINISDKELK